MIAKLQLNEDHLRVMRIIDEVGGKRFVAFGRDLRFVQDLVSVALADIVHGPRRQDDMIYLTDAGREALREALKGGGS